MEAATQEPDQASLEQAIGRTVTDMGAALNGALVMLGGELGLWKALAGAGPSTAAEVAERGGVRERSVREWLAAQAASGYLKYDAGDDAFTLPPEQAMVFAKEESPVFLLGGYRLISSAFKDRPALEERGGAPGTESWQASKEKLIFG